MFCGSRPMSHGLRLGCHPAGADVGQEVDVVLAPAGEPLVGVDADDGALRRRAAAKVRAVRRERRSLRHLDDPDRYLADAHRRLLVGQGRVGEGREGNANLR